MEKALKYASMLKWAFFACFLLVPSAAFAMSTDYSQYTPGQDMQVTCSNPYHLLEMYDLTPGGQASLLGEFACADGPTTVSFATELSHTYAFLEIQAGNYCSNVEYSGCRAQDFFVTEIHVSVDTVAIAGSPSALPDLKVSKSNYDPDETVAATCQIATHVLELYDVTSGTSGNSLGEYPCDDPVQISFHGVSGHTYALLELGTYHYCSDIAYDGCLSQIFFRSEVRFGVGQVEGGSSQNSVGLNKSTYAAGETIAATCQISNRLLELYDITDGLDAPFYAEFPCSSPTEISFDGVPEHRYALLEIDSNTYCRDLAYQGCKSQNFFRAEYTFKVVEGDNNVSSSLRSYRPEVSISSPKAGDIFSRSGTISYVALDKNDLGGLDERTRLGLSSAPVSIYYTDAVADWDHSIIAPANKTLIARGLPAAGTYVWNAINLVPGVLYRIVVDAIDAVGEVGENISDFFTVDYELPQFTVAANPPATRGAPVTITVDSSKELSVAPTVFVTQHGGKALPVLMMGSTTTFTGTYNIVSGQDGVAEITVSGSDRAGNKGSAIVSGGTFAVGVDAPPKPRLTSPTGAVATSSTVTVAGTTRNDTTVVLKVNGIDTYTATSSEDGTFSIPNVRLRFDVGHGINTISAVARDASGVTGAPATLQIKFNKEPIISGVTPSGGTVGGVVAINASSSDPNLDILSYTYQIISLRDYNPSLASSSLTASTTSQGWTTIGDNIPSHILSWDSTEADDGAYMLRVAASDGYATAISAPQQIVVRNTLPFFRFEDGRKSIVPAGTSTIVGRALTPETISPRPTLGKIEYSTDGGKKWIPVKLESGAGTPEAKFSITLGGLTEGTYGVLFRALDSRKLFGRASHPVVVDTTPPAPPSVSLAPGQVLTREDDTDSRMLGEQIIISGRAEPLSTVSLSFGSTQLSARTSGLGAFTFANVSLLSRGTYDLAFSARDEAGNTSAARVVSVVYDNAPEITFIAPKNSTGLSGNAKVMWRITDADADAISALVLAYRLGAKTFIPLASDASKSAFAWDVTNFAEGGDYELRLSASDGLATSSETVGFYIDKTPPALSSLALATTTLTKGGLVRASGEASDQLSGVEYVEYALVPSNEPGSSKDWVQAILSAGYLKKKASYTIEHKLPADDGSYDLFVRAVDAAGNTSPELSKKITVDTMPPRIGGAQLIYKGITISPSQDGTLSAYAGQAVRFAVSFEDDTASASAFVGDKEFALTRDIGSGLWEADIEASSGTGATPLYISASDEVGNKVDRKQIGTLASAARGTFATEAGEPVAGEVAIFAIDEETGGKTPFVSSAVPDGVVATDAAGHYELALPKGAYELVAHAATYKTVSQKIELPGPAFVGVSFTTQKIGIISSFWQSIFDHITWGI